MVPHVLQLVRLLCGAQLRHIGLGIVQVAELASLARAVLHARRLLALIDEMRAHRALFDNALVLAGVVRAHAVGAGHDAVLAADALAVIHQHHAVVALVAGAGGAHADAFRVVAMLARHGQVVHLQVGIGSRRAHRQHLVVERAQPHVVLLLAHDGAGVAADAAVQIDVDNVAGHVTSHPPSSPARRRSAGRRRPAGRRSAAGIS